jgi:hypothetical protein
MQCPKCGHLNTDDANLCLSCGFELTDLQLTKPKIKTSKLAILSFILAISSLFFFVITGIPAIVYGIASIRKIRKSKGTLKGVAIATLSIIISILFMTISLFFLLWRLDAPPIPNDYTIADLRSAPTDCVPSYKLFEKLIEVLKQSSDSDIPETGLSKEDISLIEKISYAIADNNSLKISNLLINNADIIKQAWNRTEIARDLIHQLNEFPEIADLYNPYVTKPLRMFDITYLHRLYRVFTDIQNEPNDIQYITNELIELDSVFRKLSLNARSLTNKLVCFAMMSQNITTANDIVNKSGTSQEALGLLAEHFGTITEEQISLKNPILCEYLFDKYAISDYDSLSLGMKVTGKIGFIKVNSTLSVFRNNFENQINIIEGNNKIPRLELSVWPTFYSFKEPSFYYNQEQVFPTKLEQIPSLYRYYNPGGSVLLIMLNNNDILKNSEQIEWITTQNELLQIVLNKRLGREIDPEKSKNVVKYIIDLENKCISNPGPDGKNGTKDDIKLQINPEVLNLTK